jgi:hypothetical protein
MDTLFLISVFALLVLVRRALTQLIFSVMFRITHKPRWVAIFYAVLFFPGVLLHEASHWLTAKLLRVPTHRFSLLPKWVGSNTLRFGYVEMTKTDSIRSSLIGIAPLITGSAAILWMAMNPLELENWFNGETELKFAGLVSGISALASVRNLWLWLYFLFAISNSMLPSSSDRNAWLPASAILAVFVIIITLIGLAPRAASWIEGPYAQFTSSLRNAFLIAVTFDILLLPPVWGLDRILQRFT